MKNTAKFIVYPTLITAIVAGCVYGFINLPSAFATVTQSNGDLVITIPNRSTTVNSTQTPQSTTSPITQIIRGREDGYQEALKKAYASEKSHEAERKSEHAVIDATSSADPTGITSDVTIAGALSSPINPPKEAQPISPRPTEATKSGDDKRNPQSTSVATKKSDDDHRNDSSGKKESEEHSGDKEHESRPETKKSK